MMLELGEAIRKHDMKVTGVFHAGAHLAEEAAEYRRLGIAPVWWVEANPAVINKIKANLRGYRNHYLIQALLYSEDGVDLQFNVTNYDGLSSSILEFGTHRDFSPNISFVERITLPTSTVDTLVEEHRIMGCNLLSMDLQGAELHCLQGAKKFLEGCEYVYSEVNKDEVYVGCAQVEQIDEFLSDFERVETLWVGTQGWGDALWIRR